MNRSIVSGIIVALVIGLAFGTVIFPRTTIMTTTQQVTTTQVITYQVTLTSIGSTSTYLQYQVVTLTAVVVDVYLFKGECTTIFGTPTVTYTNGPGGQLTTVVTVHNSTLAQQYVATVTTDYTILSVSFTTEPFTGSC